MRAAGAIAFDVTPYFAISWATIVEFDFIPDGDDAVIRVTGSGYGTDQKSQWTLVDCSIGWGEALTLVKFWLEHGVRY